MKKSLCLLAIIALITGGAAFGQDPSPYCVPIVPLAQVLKITIVQETDLDPESPTYGKSTIKSINYAWPQPGSYNFRLTFDQTFCSVEPLAVALAADVPEVSQFTYILKGINADLNGPLLLGCKDLLGLNDSQWDALDHDPSVPVPSEDPRYLGQMRPPCYCGDYGPKVGTPPAKEKCGFPLPVTENGMTDGNYELKILEDILNNPSHPQHATVTAAFKMTVENIATLLINALYTQPVYFTMVIQMPDALNGGYKDGLAPDLPAQLGLIVGGLAMLADPDTDDALNEVLGMLDAIGIPPVDLDTVRGGSGFPNLGKYGDYDGDGFDNFDEYEFFNAPGHGGPLTPAGYLAKATGIPVRVSSSPTTGKLDGDVTLRAVVDANIPPATYKWYKQGKEDPLAGKNDPTLVLEGLTLESEGYYRCQITYPSPAKAADIVKDSEWYFLRVAPNLPVAGGLGLALLAGVCALGGAMGLRRK